MPSSPGSSGSPTRRRFQAGGTVRDNALYVERPADRELPEALMQGELCFVLATRQKGLVRQGERGTHPVRYRLYDRLLQPEPAVAPVRRRLRLFYSYAAKDEPLRERLDVHLKLLERQGLIEPWHQRRPLPGSVERAEIDRHLDEADLVLLLVSPDFLASDECWDVQMTRALVRHEAGKTRVVPVLLRPCDWPSAPFAKLTPLPQDRIPVTRWTDPDDAWANVAHGLRQFITEWPAEGARR